MSYEMCLEKAGAKVLAFQEFGDYQGSWYALVEYKGERGWVEGSYGSCAGCDAFQSEFFCSYEDTQDLEERYAEFGRGYLEVVMPHEQQLGLMEALMGPVGGSYYYEDYKQVYDWMKEVAKQWSIG